MHKNSDYLQDAADYLELHGFMKTEEMTRTVFTRMGVQVVFRVGNIEVWIWQDEEEEQRAGGWYLLHTFLGAEQLDDMKMMQLFDVMGVVSIKEMVAKARAKIGSKEMADELFKMAGMQVRREAARLNYNN